MAAIINLSTYKFAPLEDLPALKATLLDAATTLRLKGTVLLAREGINVFVAGGPAEIETFLDLLRAIPRLEDLEPKRSGSADQPFGRMRVSW